MNLSIYPLLIGLCCVLMYCQPASHTNQYHEVVMRQIGNRVLWSLGDSTSRILPVIVQGDTYTIGFEQPIDMPYDTLISVAAQELHRIDVQQFIVAVKDCETEEVVLSFAFKYPLDSLLPCRGRDTESGCYRIEITLTNSKKRYDYAILPITFVLLLGGWGFRKWRQATTPTPPPMPTLRHIGEYRFDERERLLLHHGEPTPLTEKEAKLLALLLTHTSQTLSREVLMTELWGEEGVVVVSRNVDVLVSKLRKKLQADPTLAITNVHGVGYKLVENNPTEGQ
ncbi:MAG: winged helix-turn-helix domain-containing protein [Saprospiraceae bacterium]